MKKLILQQNKECFFCGKTTGLHHHEVFYGNNRQKSMDWGCQVWLCGAHHNLTDKGVHGTHGHEKDLILKKYAQKVFEEEYGHEQFMKVFKKNYL